MIKDIRIRIYLIPLLAFIVILFACKKDDNSPSNEVKDIDGNIYNTVTIGKQVWLVENLKTTRYRNGDLIGTTTPATLNISGEGETEPKYQWVINGDEVNLPTYGRLYTWYAVTDSRGICPKGWHVPSDDEWKTLEMYLGMNQTEADSIEMRGTDQGAQLKNSTGWNSGGNGTNTSGFSALPGGFRYSDGLFLSLGDYGYWWSSTENGMYSAWNRILRSNSGGGVYRDYGGKRAAFSVRCIKD